MALYVVERDLGHVPSEQFRISQRDILSACAKLKSQGKRIRYIRSAVVLGDGRGLDLFGAESFDVVHLAQEVAGVGYSRIVEVLDMTPSHLQSATSRPRRGHRQSTPARGSGHAKGTEHTMSMIPAGDLSQWLADGQRFFGLCLEALENSRLVEARVQSLEGENRMLRDEIVQLHHKVDLLQSERTEMVATFNDLAGHVTQVVDEVLQRSEDGEDAK